MTILLIPTTPIAIAFFVFVWLRTNAFIDFLGFLLLKKNIFHTQTYMKSPVQKVMEYPLWLHITYPNFVTKLFSCPLCISAWVNLAFTHNLLNWAHNAFYTLLAFVVLDRLYKHK